MSISEPDWRNGIPDKLTNYKEIHIWRAFLELSSTQNNNLLATLSADELIRVRKFHFKKDQDRFIAARGILRKIIGRYLGDRPENIRFDYTSHGKPILAKKPDLTTLQFNLSHSNAFVLYAITRNKNIGIDIEHVRDDIAAEQIAQKFFSQNEISSLKNVPEKKRNKVFFQYWTRKESLLKATGEGISFPMDQFDVSLMNEKDLSPIRFPGENKKHPQWYVQDLYLSNNYVGAIAVEGADTNISFWNYTD